MAGRVERVNALPAPNPINCFGVDVAANKHTAKSRQLPLFLEKRCACCKLNKSLDNFGSSRGRKDGLQPYCRECKAKKAHDAYFRDHERAIQRRREYAASIADRMAAYKTKWRMLNREKHNETNRLWAKKRPDLAVAKYKKYQMTKRNRVPPWADLDAIKSFYSEARRLTLETGIEHHVDHIVPLQGKTVSGLHCEQNLQVILGSVNQAKSNLTWPDSP